MPKSDWRNLQAYHQLQLQKERGLMSTATSFDTQALEQTSNSAPVMQPTLSAPHGNPNPPAPTRAPRKPRSDAGKPNPLRANRGASKFNLEANLFTPVGRETLKFWIHNGFAEEAMEVVDRLLVVTQETKALLDDLAEQKKK
jgi:hypothetical protein